MPSFFNLAFWRLIHDQKPAPFSPIFDNRSTFLRVEIRQGGKSGLTDLHKHCENFIKHLLNRVYGYKLGNLNGRANHFKGLDLGDKTKGIAYQVRSVAAPRSTIC